MIESDGEDNEIIGVSAGKKVLMLPELFEAILLQLSFQDILINAQRVCRVWSEAIRASPRLQQALFFETVPREKIQISYNPASRKVARSFKTTAGHATATCEISSTHIVVVENPMRRYLSDKQPTFDTVLRHANAAKRIDASWKRMLLSQPPVVFTSISKTEPMKLGDFGRPTWDWWANSGDVDFRRIKRPSEVHDLLC